MDILTNWRAYLLVWLVWVLLKRCSRKIETETCRKKLLLTWFIATLNTDLNSLLLLSSLGTGLMECHVSKLWSCFEIIKKKNQPNIHQEPGCRIWHCIVYYIGQKQTCTSSLSLGIVSFISYIIKSLLSKLASAMLLA